MSSSTTTPFVAAKLKEIQSLIGIGQADEALALCENLAAPGKNGASSFLVLACLATLYASKGENKKAIDALERALLIESPPPKIRQLADLYEAQGDFLKQANTLTKLYDTAKSKGNADKMIELGELISVSLSKTKAYSQAVSFLQAHLRECSSKMEASAATQRLADLYNATKLASKAESTTAKKPGLGTSVGLGSSNSSSSSSVGGASLGSSSGAAVTAAAIAPIDNPWEEHYPILLRMAELPVTENQTENMASLMEIARAFAEQWSRQLQIGTTAGEFSAILGKARELVTSHPRVQVAVPDLGCLLLLGWFYSAETETMDDTLRGIVANLLIPIEAAGDEAAPGASSSAAAASRQTLAHAVTAMDRIEAGEIRQSAAHVTACAQAWLADRAEQRKPAVPSSSASSPSSTQKTLFQRFQAQATLLALVVGQALLDFRSLAMHDALHLAQEVKRMLSGPSLLPHLAQSSKMRLAWAEAASAGRVRVISRVTPVDAMNDMLKAFPVLFDVSETGLQEAASLLTPLPEAVQWLIVLALSDLRLFDVVQRLALKPSAWLSSEQAGARLWQMLQALHSLPPADGLAGVCQPATHLLLRHTLISSESAAPILAALRAASTLPGLTKEVEARTCSRIGLLLFLVDPSDKACLASLLTSAKADPSQGAVYTLIGHYYGAAGDDDRAAKCYLKALAANVLDREAGVSLSELYAKVKNDASAEAGASRLDKLWADAIASSSVAQWAFALRGQNHLYHLRTDEAIHDLQQALEISPNDADSWQALGRCYLHNKQYNAALKSLQKALTLAPNDFLVLSSLGDAARRLTQLPAALSYCEQALALRPRDLLAAKLYAEVCLCLAYQHYSCGWVHGASRCVLQGVAVLNKVVSDAEGESGDDEELLESAHKLSGDLHCFVRFLGPTAASYDSSDVPATASPARLQTLSVQDSFARLKTLLQQGEYHYRTVLKLCSQKCVDPLTLAKCWFDIGCSVYYQVCVAMHATGQGTGLENVSGSEKDETRVLRARAMEAFSCGLRLDPLNGACWVGLALSMPHFASSTDITAARQACFVRAAEVDATQHAAYANLGMLYTKSGAVFRNSAEACFSALQLIESNPLVWVGLGSVFENDCSCTASQREWESNTELASACDAFESALEIAKPTEALLGSIVVLLKSRGCLSPAGTLLVPPAVSLAPFQLAPPGGSVKWGPSVALLKHRVQVRLSLYLERQPVHPAGWAGLAWSLERQGSGMGSARAAARCYRGALEAARNGIEATRAIATTSGSDSADRLNVCVVALQQAQVRCAFRLRLASIMGGFALDDTYKDSLALTPAALPLPPGIIFDQEVLIEQGSVEHILASALEAATTFDHIAQALQAAAKLAATTESITTSSSAALPQYAAYLSILRVVAMLLPLAGSSLDSKEADTLWTVASDCAMLVIDEMNNSLGQILNESADLFVLCVEALMRRAGGGEENARCLLSHGILWHRTSDVIQLQMACLAALPAANADAKQRREWRGALQSKIDRICGVGQEDADIIEATEETYAFLPTYVLLGRALLHLSRAEIQVQAQPGDNSKLSDESSSESTTSGLKAAEEEVHEGLQEVLRDVKCDPASIAWLRAARMNPSLWVANSKFGQ